MGEERASTLETLKTELKDAESKHETLLKELQATYKASMDGLEKLKEESAPKIKLLKAATPAPPKAAEPEAAETKEGDLQGVDGWPREAQGGVGVAAALSHDRWRRAFAWPSARCRVRVSVEVRIRYDPWPHQLPYWGRGSG